MAEQKFSKGEAIRFGWETTTQNLWFFVGLLIVVGLLYFIPKVVTRYLSSLLQFTRGPFDNLGVQILAASPSFFLGLAAWVLQFAAGIGLLRIILIFCDGAKAQFSDLFSCFPLFFKYLFGSILYGLIVVGGVLLLIVPGIIWAIAYQFFSYLIIDKKMGPVAALKKSGQITKGVKWNLFLFGLLLAGINILGALALVIGLFVTIPTTMVATAFVYRKLLTAAETAQVPT